MNTVSVTVFIDDLYKKCNVNGSLCEWNRSTVNGHGGPSQAIYWYLKFLRNDDNEPTTTGMATESMILNDTFKHYDINTKKHPLNQVLYGSAGTGKTYHTINHALAIIDNKELSDYDVSNTEARKNIQEKFNELRKIGRIEFVTFHQNFTYEDFIEGIKPVIDDDSDSNELSYTIKKGVFKQITDRALENFNLSNAGNQSYINEEELIERFAEWIHKKLNNDEVVHLFGSSQTSGATLKAVNFNLDGDFKSFTLGGSVNNQRLTKNIIIRDLLNFLKETITHYRDIEPRFASKSRHHGNAIYYLPLYEMIRKFHDNEYNPTLIEQKEKQNYVLIIDEINRGNIAKIFGELITLIEPSKREGKLDAISATLPYSKDKFSVPDNLYIIGTMNTSDRSIALLDTALRRRFEFIEMMPNAKHEKIKTDVDGINCQQLLEVINNRICVLLDREHQIGHTYFMDIDSLDKLKTVFQNQVIPLLQEYFYNDWERIDLVLNKNGFIKSSTIQAGLFESSDLIENDAKIYELESDDTIWRKVDCYQKIYKNKKKSVSNQDTDENAITDSTISVRE